ncbi:MAG: hypothetical protein RLN79_04270 [Cytophagales bacterium]
MNDLNALVGKIVLTTTHIEFIISKIVYQLHLDDEPYGFLAESNTTTKLTKLISKISSKHLRDDEFIKKLERFKYIVSHRNNLVHAILMKGQDQFLSYNYREDKQNKTKQKKIKLELGEYTIDDVVNIQNELHELNIIIVNELHELLEGTNARIQQAKVNMFKEENVIRYKKP